MVGIEHLTDGELDDIRNKCEARAQAEKVGEETVEKTGRKRGAPPNGLPDR